MGCQTDIETYRFRSRQWQLDTEQLPEGHERDMGRLLAQGYADLAALLETTGLSVAPTVSREMSHTAT